MKEVCVGVCMCAHDCVCLCVCVYERVNYPGSEYEARGDEALFGTRDRNFTGLFATCWEVLVFLLVWNLARRVTLQLLKGELNQVKI